MCEKFRRIAAAALCAAVLAGSTRAAAEAPKSAENTVGERAAGFVALTFDDGPSGRFTRRLLDGLAERGASATFFLCGYRIEQYPEAMARYCAEGHEIGIHGYSHDSMQTMTRKTLEKELRDTVALIEEEAGVIPTLLRPPGGLTGETCQTVADEANLGIILWSVDPQDWSLHDAGQIAARVLGQVRDGDVVLLHDMSDSSVDAALAIVDALQERGYQLVTVSELAGRRGQIVETGKVYDSFYP